jgi:very-short-patch-repair endonuclease
MSYTNQQDHDLLDRKLVKDLLVRLAGARVRAAPGALPRAEHLQQLLNLAGSELERKWLRHLDQHNHRLPSAAQVLIEKSKTRPDFIYEQDKVAVYIDGPVHEDPERTKRDTEQRESMEDYGWTVVRFAHSEDWPAKLAQYVRVFGRRGA